ncbi:LOW QUALITY PROTEIN: uncharacterized protein LOC114362503, partial [Ostrinia furnacalis]|uniref:LOW QUALITY PROTEIN: uncharacterized protein LOC114362503 n=1 Tax=Ostrinia furnacalis TaxID=93504 RepID=UPI00104057AF
MEYRISITLVWLLVFSFHSSYGCEMGPVGSLWLPRTYSINDTFLGDIFTDETRSIASINSIVVTTSLNGGPYFGASLVDSQFTFFTVDSNFENYEEYETETILNFNLNFNCVGGTTRAMTITINIQDTNNNDPEFIPDDEFKFTVIPPLPPGFLITNCFGEITVRDIDLTTQRIDFDIIDSSLFEIEYDAESSTVPKEFKASIRTTALIRNIPEPIVFTISATDVDLTGDQPRTTYATVTIISDGEFELPEEPVFTQTFYLATYTEDHQITLQETISLQQGYTEDVQFSLDQGSTQNFAIERNGSAISLVVATPLSAEVFAQRQILLVIMAELENTSGASATIVVELPEEEELKFEQSTYEGAIVDNVLDVPQLVLSQGYGNDPVSVEILSDHAGFFASTLQQNTITLTMSPLDEDIIEENSFLNLQVLASTNRTSASTVVTLEIVKNDTVTPVFERAVYEGEYDSMDGLTLEPIILVQGYDATVEVTLQGEHASYFQLVQEGPSISLTVSSLPSDLFREQNLLLYLSATKPRTVGATTAISIMLPPEPQLQFEQQYYRGVIEDNVLRLPSLILTDGYDNEDVSVTILSSNGINEYFTATIQENSITVTMSPLDEEIIEQNTFLNLEIVAATNRSSASTIVTLEIIKEDTVTPVFQRAIYAGAYEALDGLTLDEIELVQGYDESVLFSLQGEHSGYFEIVRVGPRINLTVSSLPTELFREQNLLLSIEATKPRTVGASAAISIALPAEIQLEFEDPSYTGVIKDNILQLSELKLSQGYDTEPVSVNIDSDYASYFTTVIDQNIITLSMSPLESNIIEENTFMNLQVIASTNRSSAMTIVTLEIVKNDTLTPVFERPLYEGVYDLSEGLVLEEIVLVQGYDDTVEVFLRGEHASFFQLVQAGPSINLTTSGLPDNLLSENNLLLYIEVTKPRTVGANTAVSISMPEARDIRFAYEFYYGTLRREEVWIQTIQLSVGYEESVTFSLSGEYASYFNVSSVQNQIMVYLREPIPDSSIEENNFLLLTLSASALNAVTATTTIGIDVVKEDLTTPVFSQNIYYGIYAGPSNINFDTISLVQGFDDSVTLHLVGEHSKYFNIILFENGTVTLELHDAIPEEVIFDEKVLLFSILAEKEFTVGANAVVSISFPSELTEPTVLRFAKNIYTGSLQQNDMSLEDIVLETGYATGTQFELTGEFSEYFTMASEGNILRLSPTNSLPVEVFSRKFISLEVEARRTRAFTVFTAVIIEVEQPEAVVPPVFAEAYYRGVYTQETGLEFEDSIQLAQGFDNTVTFTLEGESSQWFAIVQVNNTLDIAINNNIPAEVVEANHNLLFSIVARKEGATDGRAAISIDLPKEVETPTVIRFSQNNYVGQIQNGSLELPPVTLVEGYDIATQLNLSGESSQWFAIVQDNNTLDIAINNNIPAEVVEANHNLLFSIVARKEGATDGRAAISIDLPKEEETPITVIRFSQNNYVGQIQNGSLELPPVTLVGGYDIAPQLNLSGEYAPYFTLTRDFNTVTVELAVDLPTQNIAESAFIVLTIEASYPEAISGHTTIVLELVKEISTEIVTPVFEQAYYVGQYSEEQGLLFEDTIQLIQGFDEYVSFNLDGDSAQWFTLVPGSDNTYSLALSSPIPAAVVANNQKLIFVVTAQRSGGVAARATIVIALTDEITTDQVLGFDRISYVGSIANNSISLSPIVLSEGFTNEVAFTLHGGECFSDSAQWFTLVPGSDNTYSLALSSPIPAAVVANNQKLIFVVTAQRSGGVASRATIVIALTDEITTDQVLGFDQISYVGSIANNSISLSPIVLSEGFTNEVAFTLHGGECWHMP